MFKQFPEFSVVDASYKRAYEEIVHNFPPVSDLSFTTLMIWWNFNDSLRISKLRNNLVIEYNNLSPHEQPGLCLVGIDHIEESLKDIFEYQRQQGMKPRLLHVPEFVAGHVVDSSAYSVSPEPDYDEYILSAKDLATLEGPDHSRTRRKVARFLREANQGVEMRQLDLSDAATVNLLMTSAKVWADQYGRPNDMQGDEFKALERSLGGAAELGMEALGVYVGGVLHGFVAFQHSHDGQYIIANHLKVKYELPHVFDYVTQQLAAHAVDKSVPYLNYEMDLGIPGLRFHKQGLRPVSFMRKFTIEPAQS